VLHLTREPEHPPAPAIAAAFQESVVDVLAAKTAAAAKEHAVRLVMLAGGVASNSALREAIVARSPVPVRYPAEVLHGQRCHDRCLRPSPRPASAAASTSMSSRTRDSQADRPGALATPSRPEPGID
jgi:hypothetical protein